MTSSIGMSCPAFSDMYQRCSRTSWKTSAGSSFLARSRGTVRVTGLDVAGLDDRALSVVRATRIGFVFQTEIGVLHPGFGLAAVIYAEQSGQPEVVPADAPLVAQAGFVSGNHAAAAANEFLDLPALRVGKGDNVRQDKRLELANVRGIQKPVMHQLKRDARLDQCLIPAVDGVLDLMADERVTVAAGVPSVWLGVADELARLTYDGLWFSALHRDLRGYVASSQRVVSGDARIRLDHGNAVLVGRQSPLSLYDRSLATYEADDAFDHASAVGFIEIFGLPLRVEAARHGAVGKFHGAAWSWTEPLLDVLPTTVANPAGSAAG